MLPVCTNCKKVKCLNGQTPTIAFEGLKVRNCGAACVNRPKNSIQYHAEGTVLRYSKNAFTHYNPASKRADTGSLLVMYKDDDNDYLYYNTSGFFFNCKQG